MKCIGRVNYCTRLNYLHGRNQCPYNTDTPYKPLSCLQQESSGTIPRLLQTLLTHMPQKYIERDSIVPPFHKLPTAFSGHVFVDER